MESTADAAAPGAAAAGSTSSSAATAAPPKPEVKSWADEADEEDDKAPPPSSDDKADDLKKMEALRIREEEKAAAGGSEEAKAGLGKGLDEPDDSAIRAVTSGDTVYTSALSFEDLNLSKELIQGLYVEMGFKRPSKIQAVSLPMILTPPHKHLVAQAHNGSGKTTCFVLGMLSRVDPQKKLPQALCICPTRELARQNEAVLLRMGKYTGITSICAIFTFSPHYVPIMKRAPITEQVVIGTPGTIKKWMSAKKLSTREMKILVFDEADHMLAEDGFRDDSERIMKEIERNSPKCQARELAQQPLHSGELCNTMTTIGEEKVVAVREVWKSNLWEEVLLILEASESYPYVALDTEFPGFVHQTPRFASADDRYRDVKHNVDHMKLIQLGLTFFGRGGGQRLTWQINLREFDVSSPLDARSEPSVELLRRSGLDLERTRREGVDSAVLSAVLQDSGWFGAAEQGVGGRRRPAWVTFQGIYDVAYLVKLLTGSPLPETLAEFVHLVGKTLGSVFDAKYAAGLCGSLPGGNRMGLVRLSEALQVKAGGINAAHHQAGYDSLLTAMVFEAMTQRFHLPRHALEGVLSGMEQHRIVAPNKGGLLKLEGATRTTGPSAGLVMNRSFRLPAAVVMRPAICRLPPPFGLRPLPGPGYVKFPVHVMVSSPPVVPLLVPPPSPCGYIVRRGNALF